MDWPGEAMTRFPLGPLVAAVLLPVRVLAQDVDLEGLS